MGANLSPQYIFLGERYRDPLPAVSAKGPRTLEPRPQEAGHDNAQLCIWP